MQIAYDGVTRRAFIVAGTGATTGAGLLAGNRGEIAGVPAEVARVVREHARPIHGTESDFYPVLDMARDASFLLLGEASHGTQEFYATRAEISRRLIEDLQFNAVVVEADWPDAARLHRFVLGGDNDSTAEQALGDLGSFPEWMWRNTAVRDFAAWLRGHNATKTSEGVPTGFYGMDLYSIAESAQAVIQYLGGIDAEEAAKAQERYASLLQHGSDGQTYGAAVAYGSAPSATKAVKKQWEELVRITEGRQDAASFDALQNARLVVNAEEYYRGMYRGNINSWNHRDLHMADTLDALAAFLKRRDGYAKIIVWAHNSHLGDARATDSKRRGEWNVGQLMRERHGSQTVSVGFTTNTGTVLAADDWGSPGVVKNVRPSLPGTWERAFQQADIPAFVLNLREEPVARALSVPLLERAIGVIYRPETERQSHYFEANIARQFDLVIHFSETRAVEPLGVPAEASTSESSTEVVSVVPVS